MPVFRECLIYEVSDCAITSYVPKIGMDGHPDLAVDHDFVWKNPAQRLSFVDHIRRKEADADSCEDSLV
jgi:hypothetical protein